MTKKIEPATDSTQLTQLALDTALQTLSDATRLPIARLQRSIAYEKSPIRNIYHALNESLQAEKKFQASFDMVKNYREQLAQRKAAVDAEFEFALLEGDPKNTAIYNDEIALQAEFQKRLETLERKTNRLYQKFQSFNQTRLLHIEQYAKQYHVSREELRTLLIENGYSSFSEENLDNTLAYLCHIRDKASENALYPSNAPLHKQLGLVSKSQPIEDAIKEVCHV